METGNITGEHSFPSFTDPTHAAATSIEGNLAKIPSSTASAMSRASSQVSTTSAASAVSRKPAPPVPKKPTVLSSPNDQNLGEAAQAPDSRSQDVTRFRRPMASRPLPNPSASLPMPRRSPDIDGPPLPPRGIAGRAGPNALMDDDISGASTIPSLQPQRRG